MEWTVDSGNGPVGSMVMPSGFEREWTSVSGGGHNDDACGHDGYAFGF